MSLDIAYSIEVDDFIDPDKAYELYWAGKIKNKRDFLCPGTNCKVKVTCINLDKDSESLKMVPHYRMFGNHDENCEIFNDVPLKFTYETPHEQISENKFVDSSVVDMFIENRPASYYDDVNADSKSKTEKSKSTTAIESKANRRLREIGSSSNIYSVRSVVSRYVRYRNDGTLNTRRLNIKGKDIPYSSIFYEIGSQKISNIPQLPAIYFGWAYVNRLPSDNGYQIKFKKKSTDTDEKNQYITTIMIADRLINSYKIKKLVSTRLDKIYSETNPTAFVFVYGTPKINMKNEKYANIDITNLDLIDIGQEDPWI